MPYVNIHFVHKNFLLVSISLKIVSLTLVEPSLALISFSTPPGFNLKQARHQEGLSHFFKARFDLILKILTFNSLEKMIELLREIYFSIEMLSRCFIV